MVEPLTLGVIVAALVAKALERMEEKVVDEGEGALRRLLAALRRRFGAEDEQAGTAVLERLADAPGSAQRQRDLAHLLDEHAAAFPAFRQELEALVEEVRDAGVDVASIAQISSGDQNVQIANLKDSQVNVRYGQHPDGPPAPTSQ